MSMVECDYNNILIKEEAIMRKITKKLVSMGLSIVTCLAMVTGCGSSTTESTATGSESSDGVKTIEVAVANGQPPYTYTDENGEITGLDVKILQAVDELLPEYEFNISIVDWDTMCAGVQSGKYAVGSCCLLNTPARQEVYLLSDDIYYYLMNLVVRSDSDINSLEDMDGKSMSPFPDSDGLAYVLKQFNEAHPDINITRESASEAVPYADAYAGVQSGRWDAWFGDGASYEVVAKENPDLDLKVTDYVAAAPACFIINKNETDLQTAINGALGTLKEDGTLAELSVEWLGQDVFEIGEPLLNN